MKKYRKNIVLLILALSALIGLYLYQFRIRPLPGVGGELAWISVTDNRTDPSVKQELGEGEAGVLAVKLKSLKMKWSGSRVQPFSIENVQFFVDYISDGEPFHLVLGDPCFAYESAGHAKYLIIQDDAYRRLMTELQDMSTP